MFYLPDLGDGQKERFFYVGTGLEEPLHSPCGSLFDKETDLDPFNCGNLMFVLLISSKNRNRFSRKHISSLLRRGDFKELWLNKNCKNVMVAREPDTTLTLEQNGKVVGPWCEVEFNDDKDTKSTLRLSEEEDSNAVQIHVLVVDDNFVDRKIVERLVKSASFNVTAVDSGARALKALSLNRHINLIITDYCMPEMCGYDLLRHVKGAPTSKDIPVVLMSSENVPNRIQSCLDEGAVEFLLKPVRLSDVKRLKSYVLASNGNNMEQQSLLCKKRKFNAEGFQVQSPESGPLIGSVTVG